MKLRMNYARGWECTHCQQVHMDEPSVCLNCGRHTFIDLLAGPMADDPKGYEIRLSRASGVPRIVRYRRGE